MHRLLLGDAVAMLPGLLDGVDAVVCDPPYGIGYRVNRRAPRSGIPGLSPEATAARAPIVGDDTPFDPAPWLTASLAAFCGANHFARCLPTGGRWIVWDKRGDMKPDSHSDCELVWLNCKGADRIHRQKWRGVCREGEENCARSKKLHTNQKPVALMTRVLIELGVEPGMTVLDPYMGSGSTGVAAVRLGCSFIGVEIDPQYYAVASTRLAREDIFA